MPVEVIPDSARGSGFQSGTAGLLAYTRSLSALSTGHWAATQTAVYEAASALQSPEKPGAFHLFV